MVRKRGSTTRHNRIVHELAALARDAGMSIRIEPRTDDSKNRNRVDIQLIGSQGVLLVDVSICQPTASSYYLAASKKAGSATRIREQIKHKKYDDIASKEGATLFPFVLETFGYVAEEGQKLLRAISKEAAYHGYYDEDEFYSAALTRMAFSLQRNHAYAMMKCASQLCGSIR
jgi:hypothetical protein